jgi:hypothetical protein
MCCVMTDGHIYTFNYDVKRLEQKQYDQEDFNSEAYAPRVGDVYYISEDAKPPTSQNDHKHWRHLASSSRRARAR